jgi:hypothetical protein
MRREAGVGSRGDGVKKMTTELERIRALTPNDLLVLGMKNMAYMKDMEVDGETVVGLFAANGQQIAVVEDRETAVAAAWQNGLAPMTVH